MVEEQSRQLYRLSMNLEAFRGEYQRGCDHSSHASERIFSVLEDNYTLTRDVQQGQKELENNIRQMQEDLLCIVQDLAEEIWAPQRQLSSGSVLEDPERLVLTPRADDQRVAEVLGSAPGGVRELAQGPLTGNDTV